MNAGDICVVEINNELPANLPILADEAKAEGYQHVNRLVADWTSGALRFEQPGEALLAAYVENQLVGVGGVTIEPRLPNAVRMRRFYVRPLSRRQGIGRLLAGVLMRRASTTADVVMCFGVV